MSRLISEVELGYKPEAGQCPWRELNAWMGQELWSLEVRGGAGLRVANMAFLMYPLVAPVSLGESATAELSGLSQELGFRHQVCVRPHQPPSSPWADYCLIWWQHPPLHFRSPSPALHGA